MTNINAANTHPCVYVIGHDESPMVKIGFSRKVKRRITEMQPTCPYKLKLIWWCFGTQSDEQSMHRVFSSRRRHGEWFDFSGTDFRTEFGRLFGYDAKLDNGINVFASSEWILEEHNIQNPQRFSEIEDAMEPQHRAEK